MYVYLREMEMEMSNINDEMRVCNKVKGKYFNFSLWRLEKNAGSFMVNESFESWKAALASHLFRTLAIDFSNNDILLSKLCFILEETFKFLDILCQQHQIFIVNSIAISQNTAVWWIRNYLKLLWEGSYLASIIQT